MIIYQEQKEKIPYYNLEFFDTVIRNKKTNIPDYKDYIPNNTVIFRGY